MLLGMYGGGFEGLRLKVESQLRSYVAGVVDVEQYV